MCSHADESHGLDYKVVARNQEIQDHLRENPEDPLRLAFRGLNCFDNHLLGCQCLVIVWSGQICWIGQIGIPQDIEWFLVLDLLIVPQVQSSFGILQGRMTKHELVLRDFSSSSDSYPSR